MFKKSSSVLIVCLKYDTERSLMKGVRTKQIPTKRELTKRAKEIFLKMTLPTVFYILMKQDNKTYYLNSHNYIFIMDWNSKNVLERRK